jgi:protocatechuate 3,4-dioxygenase alpha subunit
MDETGTPLPNAMLQVWQADAKGRFAPDADFHDFGRSGTDHSGTDRFRTVKPGRVLGSDASPQAPHPSVIVFARGMLVHAFNRIHFEDELSNEEDTVLSSLDPTRRWTLLAGREGMSDATVYRLEVRPGEDETVFFDA